MLALREGGIRVINRLIIASFMVAAVARAEAVGADVVTDWNRVALDAMKVENPGPPAAARALAILHVSIYDAVNGITRTHAVYHVHGNGPASASVEAAASAAAHDALVSLFPASAASFDSQYAASIAALPRKPQTAAGIEWGRYVAQQMLAWRAGDGADAVVPVPDDTAPGYWIPTPPRLALYLLPHFGFVTPFAMTSPDQFRPSGPPALTSEAWAAAYNEVKAYGAAVNSLRTPDQSEIAVFWADDAGTETPPGHFNHIARDVAIRAETTLDENARLFALLNIAMADAGISAWDGKYRHDFWRPVTAIHAGATDGNAATAPDPTWQSFIVTPPFPEYFSGHSTFGAAAATVLALFFGSDNVSFTSTSDALPGVVRHFRTFSSAAIENAVSRVYGGVHYRFSNQDGLTAGGHIGEWTFTHYLQPTGNRGRQR